MRLATIFTGNEGLDAECLRLAKEKRQPPQESAGPFPLAKTIAIQFTASP